MQTKWLNKKGNSKLILFFNGWGMDEQPLKHLEFDSLDVVMFYNYNQMEAIPEDIYSGYNKVWVIAWSMGVWAAGHILDKSNVEVVGSLAINGTNWGIDDEKGIPAAMFKATRDHFSELSREKFFLRMCGNRKVFQFFQLQEPDRSLESQKEELSYFIEAVEQYGKAKFIWDKAIIGTGDRIFPVDNMKCAWEGTNTILMDFSHYPFRKAASWCELLNLMNYDG